MVQHLKSDTKNLILTLNLTLNLSLTLTLVLTLNLKLTLTPLKKLRNLFSSKISEKFECYCYRHFVTLTYRIVVAPTIINFGIFSQGYFLIWWATFINLEVFIWGLPLFDVLDTKFITFCHIFCLFSSIIAWIFLTLSQNFSFLKK